MNEFLKKSELQLVIPDCWIFYIWELKTKKNQVLKKPEDFSVLK